ncbi:MAG: class I SAM-dependent methyltransferase [Spirochaetales bacterium]
MGYDRVAMYEHARLYADAHRQVTEDLPFYRRIVGSERSRVLELGCGSGRVAISLAADGHEVTGVDISEAMLAVAREEAQRARIDESQLTLVKRDMRRLAFDAIFDVVLLPLNGVGHLHADEDLHALFTSVRRLLSEAGVFVLHLFRFGSGLAPGGDALTSRGVFASSRFGGAVEWYESRRFPEQGFERLVWYFIPESGGECEPVVSQLDLRIHNPEHVCERAGTAGFELAEAYGDFRGNPPSHTRPDWIGLFRPVTGRGRASRSRSRASDSE